MPNAGLTLNLGSGKDYRDDAINADIRPDVGADWVVDISDLHIGGIVKWKDNYVPIKRGGFERIIAFDVLEHIPNLVKAMTNCRDAHLDYKLSEYGKTLELGLDELLRTPRAVDSMYVVLRKIPV